MRSFFSYLCCCRGNTVKVASSRPKTILSKVPKSIITEVKIIPNEDSIHIQTGALTGLLISHPEVDISVHINSVLSNNTNYINQSKIMHKINELSEGVDSFVIKNAP